MGLGGGSNGVEVRMVDCSPAVAIMVKPDPRFLDEDNVCCLVCDYYYYISFYACSL